MVTFSSLFMACNQSYETTTIYLVRHAEKVGKLDSLSQKGVARASRLNKVLESVEIDSVFSTNYKRTLQTVEPLAQSKEREVVIYDPGNLVEFAERLNAINGRSVIVVGHSNTTPKLINLLLKEDKLENLNEKDYDNLYVLQKVSANTFNFINLKY